MKVCFVGAGFPPGSPGGTEAHMLDLGVGLLALGHEVSVFCRTSEEGRPHLSVADREFAGIRVREFRQDWSGIRNLGDVLCDPGVDKRFREMLDETEPDLVHVHHLSGLSQGIIDVAKDRGLPVVMTLHDFWMACLRGQRITPELEVCTTLDRKRCAPCLDRLWPHFGIDVRMLEDADAGVLARMRRVDRFIAPSAFHRERMIEFGLDPARIRAVEHGLDSERLVSERVPSQDRFRIGFLGSVIPSKGVHVLVDAMARLAREDLECHVHGEAPSFHGDTGYRERLETAASSARNVVFHGAYAREDLPGILAGLDLVVVPSLWWESFCLTLREAMAAGVPVLASDHGAMREALGDLELPLLFRPGDAEDLAHKIAAVARDPELRKRASRLQTRVRTIEGMAKETAGIYRDLAGDPGQRRAHSALLAQRKRKGAAAPYATVFVPTWNSGPLFRGVLDKILAQKADFDYEILVIDSGSTDGTLDLLEAHPEIRLIRIPNSEFNHGLTRNRAVREARGEIVVLLTHDAEPYDDRWLERIVSNFDDPEVAGAYCHQIPRPDCNPFQRDRLRGWTFGEGSPERRRLADPGRFQAMHPFDRYRLIAFDDVASAVRKSVMEKIPFEKRQFGEDVAWGKQAILAGHTLVMDPRSVVIHSHDKPVFYEFKRVYLDHQNLHDLVGLHTVPTFWLVLKFSLKATAHLLSVVWREPSGLARRLYWTLKTPLYAFTQNLAQYLGASSAKAKGQGFMGRLDRWLRKGV